MLLCHEGVNIFSENGHAAYQFEGDNERNRIQVKSLS